MNQGSRNGRIGPEGTMQPEESFASLLSRLAENVPDRTALRWDPSDPSKCLTYQELYERVLHRREELSMERTVLLTGKQGVDWIVTLLASLIGDHMTVLFDPSLSLDAAYEFWQETEEYHPGALLFFTSGTTSRGKAVVLSQKAILRSAWNGQSMLPCREEDRLLSVLPLNHVFGFVCSFLWPLCQGAEIDLGTGLRGLLTDAKAYHPTVLSAVPTLLAMLLKADALNPELRVILVGAGPLGRETIDQVLSKGIHLRFGYGLTETASGVAISMSDDDPYSFWPCPDTKALLSPEGELLLQTSCMMEGYYGRPEDTKEKLVNGTLHTGDLAKIDEKGHIRILGRLNEVLVMPNGEKVFCPEIEEELARTLNRDCVLVLRKEHLTLLVHGEEADRNHVNRAVDEWNKKQTIGQKILGVEIRPEDFPRTATGKIRRFLLEQS